MKTALAALALAVLSPGLPTSPQTSPSTQSPAPKPVPPKPGPEHRQFDFWIGEWDVTVQGKPAGTNVIRSVQSGFALEESWTSAGGGTGTSLNFFDRSDRKWHQVWIDASGNALFLAGGLEDGKMVLESDGKNGVVQRVTWTPNPDGTVRQLWDSSSDGAKTWTVVFDGLYRRRK